MARARRWYAGPLYQLAKHDGSTGCSHRINGGVADAWLMMFCGERNVEMLCPTNLRSVTASEPPRNRARRA